MSHQTPPTISVVTPSIGRDELARAIRSVIVCAGETITVEHLIIADGPGFEDAVRAIVDQINPPKNVQLHILVAPFNTRRSGAICRALGATIARGDYVAFLDDDNWFLPDHFTSCLQVMQEHPKLSWMHTGRYILNEQQTQIGQETMEDLSQSLGLFHHEWFNPFHHMADTNCFFIAGRVSREAAPHWHLNPIFANWGEDRVLYAWLLRHHPNHAFLFNPSVAYIANQEVFDLISQGNHRIGSKTQKHRGRLFRFGRSYSFPIKSWICKQIIKHKTKAYNKKRLAEESK